MTPGEKVKQQLQELKRRRAEKKAWKDQYVASPAPSADRAIKELK